MANLNRIILVGRVTTDPEGRTTMDGLPMCKFRLEVSRPQGIGQGGTDFFDIIAWRREAEACREHCQKGKIVLVEGRIQIRSFEDQAGQRRWATEIVARDVRVLEGAQVTSDKRQANNEPAPQDPGPEAEEELIDEADLASDLPF